MADKTATSTALGYCREKFMSILSRSVQNITQVLRYVLRFEDTGIYSSSKTSLLSDAATRNGSALFNIQLGV